MKASFNRTVNVKKYVEGKKLKSGSNSSANVKLTNFRGSIARDPIPTNTLLRPSSNQQTVPLNFNFLFLFFFIISIFLVPRQGPVSRKSRQ